MSKCLATTMSMEELENMLCGEVDPNPVYVRIQSYQTNLYLTGGINNNSMITQQGFMNNDLQLWSVVQVSASAQTYYLINKRTNRVAAVPNNSKQGSNVQTSNMANSSTQQWKITEVMAGGIYTIKNVMTGYTMDIPKGTQNVGVGVIQFGENGGENQMFKFVTVECSIYG